MSKIPKGWAHAKLETLYSADGIFSDGDWIESKDQDPNGTNRLLQLADIGDGYFLDKSFRFVNDQKFSLLNCTEILEGDVLIARMPDPLGRACLAPKLPQRSLTVVDVAIFRSGKHGVLPRWLMHFLNSPVIRAHIDSNASGTTRKRISRGNLSSMVLPVPPLLEQGRIADKLDSTFVRVARCRDRLARVESLLQRFRQSVLTTAMNGRLTADWRTSVLGSRKTQLSQKADSKSIQENEELPTDWRRITLADVTLDLRYGTSKKCSYSDDGHVVLRIPNMGDRGKIDLSNVKRAEFVASEINVLRLEIGDLLLIRSNGSADLVGKTCLVTKKEEGLLFAGYLMRLRVSTDVVLPAYVALTMASPELRAVIEATSKSTSGVNNINSGEVKSLPLSLPPILEQTEIVRRVEALFAFADRIEARLANAQTAVDKLTPALLAKAFRGELVPQDPADEPANELLKRLVAEREAAPKTKSKRASKTA